MPPYSLFYVNFPAGCGGNIHGITGKYKDGRYTIAIDAAQDKAIQDFALKHELAHLYLKHLDNLSKPEEECEREADEYAERMTAEELEYLLSFCKKKEVKPPDFMEKYEAMQRYKQTLTLKKGGNEC
jgi:Zn-dependent peptidase ImmA (M78 family)